MDLLIDNCKLNDVAERVECKKLLWGENLESMAERFDIVLGADIIYEQEYVVALFKTARHFLSDKPCAKFILAYTKRNVSIDYVLNTATSFGFEWEAPTTDEGIYTFRVKQA